MTYTVFNSQNSDRAWSGLSARDAAELMITRDDGYGFEFRPEADGVGWRLWVTLVGGGGNHPMVSSRHFSLTMDRDAAEAEICAEIIAERRWGRMEVMTDAEFEAVMAQLAADNAEEDAA